MLIRWKVVITVVVLISVMILGICGVMQLTMIPALEQIEAREASEDIFSVVRIIQNELNNMQGSALDWSTWDDTYHFAKERGDIYIENNIIDSTFTSLKLDFMLYYDMNGTLFYGKGYDYREFRPLIIPGYLYTNPAQSLVLQAREKERGEIPVAKGILALPEGPLLICVSPILRSDSSGLPAGYLGIARYLDDAEVQKIAGLTSTNLSVTPAGTAGVPINNSPLSPEALRYPASEVGISKDSESITSATVLGDIHGDPGVAITVMSPRETYRIAESAILFFLAITVGIGCFCVLAVIYTLNQSFLRRLTSLEENMKCIADSRDFSGRVEVSGKDEIASLSSRINLTLEALENHVASEREAVRNARIANEKLNLLSNITSHDILNQITVIRGFCELAKDVLPPGSPAIPYIERINTASTIIEDQLSFTREY